jgi:hypothetical protein
MLSAVRGGEFIESLALHAIASHRHSDVISGSF